MYVWKMMLNNLTSLVNLFFALPRGHFCGHSLANTMIISMNKISSLFNLNTHYTLHRGQDTNKIKIYLLTMFTYSWLIKNQSEQLWVFCLCNFFYHVLIIVQSFNSFFNIIYLSGAPISEYFLILSWLEPSIKGNALS